MVIGNAEERASERKLLIFAHENQIDKTITGSSSEHFSRDSKLFYYGSACKLDGKPKFYTFTNTHTHPILCECCRCERMHLIMANGTRINFGTLHTLSNKSISLNV